jgi:hypothetical protein
MQKIIKSPNILKNSSNLIGHKYKSSEKSVFLYGLPSGFIYLYSRFNLSTWKIQLVRTRLKFRTLCVWMLNDGSGGREVIWVVFWNGRFWFIFSGWSTVCFWLGCWHKPSSSPLTSKIYLILLIFIYKRITYTSWLANSGCI